MTSAVPEGAGIEPVHEPRSRVGRRRVRGALADVLTAAALDALEAALDDTKAERIAAVERRWA